MKHRAQDGFTLMELLLALALGMAVLAGLLKLVQAVTVAVRTQQALRDLTTAARYVETEVAAGVEAAGFLPEPWAGDPPPPFEGSVDGGPGNGDRLVVRGWSQRNCFGRANPKKAANGEPAFGLLEAEYRTRDGARLVKTCHYGPGTGPGTRQINAATILEGAEAFEVRFAEDRDADGTVDAWVDAGGWEKEDRVLGVRFAVLLASPQSVNADHAGTVSVLNRTVTTPDDGRARRVVLATVPLRGRLP